MHLNFVIKPPCSSDLFGVTFVFYHQWQGNLGKYFIKWKLEVLHYGNVVCFKLTQVCLPKWERSWTKAQTPDSCVSLAEGERMVLWHVPPWTRSPFFF